MTEVGFQRSDREVAVSDPPKDRCLAYTAIPQLQPVHPSPLPCSNYPHANFGGLVPDAGTGSPSFGGGHTWRVPSSSTEGKTPQVSSL